jgi:hypothetical protein
LSIYAGKEDPDAGSGAGLADDGDATPALLGDSAHHGQAEAGALALGLRGEEWFEEVVHGLPAHAGAGVAHCEDHVGSRGHMQGARLAPRQLRIAGLPRYRPLDRFIAANNALPWVQLEIGHP